MLPQAALSTFPIFLETEQSHNTLTQLHLRLPLPISQYLWMLIPPNLFHSQVFLTSSNRMGPWQSVSEEKEINKIEEINVNLRLVNVNEDTFNFKSVTRIQIGVSDRRPDPRSFLH